MCHQCHCLTDISPLCAVALNANRHVSGVLRGFDQFMNIVLDNAVDEKNKTDIGMVVCPSAFPRMPDAHAIHAAKAQRCQDDSVQVGLLFAASLGCMEEMSQPQITACSCSQACIPLQVVRGNSIVTVEVLERL